MVSWNCLSVIPAFSFAVERNCLAVSSCGWVELGSEVRDGLRAWSEERGGLRAFLWPLALLVIGCGNVDLQKWFVLFS